MSDSALRDAAGSGVEVYALGAAITPDRLELTKTLPVTLDGGRG